MASTKDKHGRPVVVVTGVGVVTSLGAGKADNWAKLTAGESGIRAITRGEEGGNASTLQATSEVRLAPVAEGTRVDYRSEVAITGRLGRFALGMMKKKAQSLGDEFAANLQARLAAQPSEPQEARAAATVGAGEEPAAGRVPTLTSATAPTENAQVPGAEPRHAAWQRILDWLRRALDLGSRKTRTPH